MRPTISIAGIACTLVSLQLTPGQPQANGAWPDYRGPHCDGHAPDASVPLRWSEKKNVRWKIPIAGTGWSSPVILHDRIWLTSADGKGHRMSVIAIDARTGAKIHERTLFENESPARKNRLNSYASPSPTIEDGRVYVHFGAFGTACLDTGSGETIWQRRDIPCDHKEGPGSSPILCNDLLIFNSDGTDAQYVIALDKKTGATRWRRPRSTDLSRLTADYKKAYSTPIVINVDGKQRLISSGAQATMAYDPATGEELWKVRHAGFSMSARPLASDGILFLNTGYMRARLIAVRASGTGDVTDDNVVWSYRRGVPTMASSLLIDGRIYMINDGGIASCLDAKTGKRLWLKRIGGQHCASPVYAGGRIYFFDRDGRTIVIAPGKRFRQLAVNQLADGFMASPAVVGDAFVLRTKTHLYRIESTPTPPRVQDETTAGWSRFRGPNGNGIARTSGLPVEFGRGENGKNVVWKTTLPPGRSSPVLSETHVFLTAFEGDSLLTYCLDRKTGDITWRQKAERKRITKVDKRNDAASPTPAVDTDTVAVFFPDVGLIAYDHAGERRWTLPLGPFDNVYGMGASPILLGDRVFLPCDQNTGSFLIAVDKTNGKVLWKVDRREAMSGHCTPIFYQPNEGATQLILPGSFLLDAYDTESGKKVWWIRGLSFEMKSTPVLHEGTIYINGYGSQFNQPGKHLTLPPFKQALVEYDADRDGEISKAEMPKTRARRFYDFIDLEGDGSFNEDDWRVFRAALASKNGMLAIKAGGHGDMTDKSVTWAYRRQVPQLPSPLLYDGVLYMLADQSGIITTLRPDSGKLIERGRLKDAIDNYYASPVAADGKVYLVSENGLVTVLQRGGKLEPLGVSDLDEICHATPAIAGGRIYLRTKSALYCFGIRKGKR